MVPKILKKENQVNDPLMWFSVQIFGILLLFFYYLFLVEFLILCLYAFFITLGILSDKRESLSNMHRFAVLHTPAAASIVKVEL